MVKSCKRLLTSLKNRPYLSCDLHHLGAILYSKMPVALFWSKKVWHWMEGRMGGWMDGWFSRVKDCLQQSKRDL